MSRRFHATQFLELTWKEGTPSYYWYLLRRMDVNVCHPRQSKTHSHAFFAQNTTFVTH